MTTLIDETQDLIDSIETGSLETFEPEYLLLRKWLASQQECKITKTLIDETRALLTRLEGQETFEPEYSLLRKWSSLELDSS